MNSQDHWEVNPIHVGDVDGEEKESITLVLKDGTNKSRRASIFSSTKAIVERSGSIKIAPADRVRVSSTSNLVDGLPQITVEKTKADDNRPPISYEMFVWFVYGVVCSLAIIDRFTWNFWPRQMFSIGKGGAGSDRLEIIEGPWSVVFYDVLARISGRYCIVAYNLLIVTRLRFLMEWLPTSFIGKYIVDCSGMVTGNLRLHRWNGFALCVLTLLHVWSILLPCVTHSFNVQVLVGFFEWPISERKPKGFKDADVANKMMSLQVDDVFRIVEMTVFLGILMPICVRWFETRWHVGIRLHQIINLVYFVDIVRRHTHPHSWVLNTPFFCLWLLDNIWAFFWRKAKPNTVHRKKISADYMLLAFNGAFNHETVGPDYHWRLNDSSFLEKAHVFTCFENRLLIELDDEISNWTVGSVVRVFRNERVPKLGSKDSHSHTGRMYDTPELSNAVTIWGPCYGEMSLDIRYHLKERAPVVLVGAGSGCNYIIDALQWYNRSSCPMMILYTTRDKKLYHWVANVMARVVRVGCPNLQVILALTSGRTGKVIGVKGSGGSDVCTIQKQIQEQHYAVHSYFTFHEGRINFKPELFPWSSFVYCQGGKILKETVKSACEEMNCSFYGGLGGLG